VIANLTGLTGLTWVGTEMVEAITIAPLTQLTGLRSVRLRSFLSDRSLAIACSFSPGSLVSLDFSTKFGLWAARIGLLAGQTSLKHLALTGWPLCELSHIGAVRIELLQSLKLAMMKSEEAPLLDALRQAASVTALSIGINKVGSHKGLTQALAGLTQLRSLALSFPSGGHSLDTPRDLTTLTRLYIAGATLDNEDLQALLILTTCESWTLAIVA
jgi:hypothetical protein